MHLSALEEYGLRCMLQLAGGARRAAGEPLAIGEIANAEGLSPEYTAKLMGTLRRGGLVTSVRGAGGGYRLARPASEIAVWTVLQTLGGGLFPDGFCEDHPGRERDCVHTTDCTLRALWGAAENAVREVLERVSLADLLGPENTVRAWLADAGRGSNDLPVV